MKAFERAVPLAVAGAMAFGFNAACTDPENVSGIPPKEVNPAPPAAAETFAPYMEVPGDFVYDSLNNSRKLVVGAIACLGASKKTGSMITADLVSYSNEPYARGKDGASGTSDDRLFFSVSRDTITNTLTYRLAEKDKWRTRANESRSVEVNIWADPASPALIDGNANLTLKQIKDTGLDPAATPNGMTIVDGDYAQSIAQHDVNSISAWDVIDPKTGVVTGKADAMDANAMHGRLLRLLAKMAKANGVKNCA